MRAQVGGSTALAAHLADRWTAARLVAWSDAPANRRTARQKVNPHRCARGPQHVSSGSAGSAAPTVAGSVVQHCAGTAARLVGAMFVISLLLAPETNRRPERKYALACGFLCARRDSNS